MSFGKVLLIIFAVGTCLKFRQNPIGFLNGVQRIGEEFTADFQVFDDSAYGRTDYDSRGFGSSDSNAFDGTAPDFTGGYAADPAVFGYYGSQLNADEQTVYSALYTAVCSLQDSCDVQTGSAFSDENMGRAVTSLTYDHPELFWLSGAYTYQRNVFSNDWHVNLDFYDFWTYSGAKEQYIQQLRDRVDAIVAAANRYGSDSEKAQYVHDYLITNVAYSYAELEERNKTYHDARYDTIGTAYGCLVEGRCVCAGYAYAYSLILHRLGIPCIYVVGKTDADAPDTYHAWNCAQLGGNWYYIDVTWDDSDDGYVRYDYFGAPAGRLFSDHRLIADHQFIYPT